MDQTMTWIAAVAFLVSLWMVIAYRSGPHAAIGIVVLVATLFPTWSYLPMGSLKLYVRDVVSLIVLGCYCFHRKATFPWRLGIHDGLLGVLVLLHLSSDAINDGLLKNGLDWGLLVRAYTEWCVPYIAARLAFSDPESPKQMAPWGAVIACVLAVYGVGESLSGLHPVEWIYGHRPDENFSRESIRWGLLRPWGPTAHAIYFGFVQLMLAPWAWMMTSQALRGERSPFWLSASILSSMGVFISLSRAPLLAMVIMIAIGLAVLVRQTRIPLGIALALALVFGVVQHEKVIRWLEQSGESTTNAKKGQIIIVDGKSVEYSGTMTRVYLFSIYARAMKMAGFTGFGTQRTSVFPPNIPMGAEDRSTWSLVKFVDNSYVLMTLRFGWLGGVVLALMGIASAWTWIRFSLHQRGDLQLLGAWMGAGILASMLVLFTVWLAHDFKFLVFWLYGSATGSLLREVVEVPKPRRRRT